MNRILAAVSVILVVLTGPAFPDTHYASKAGSNTYPYQSWETAADSISKAIDASESGDTVRVGVGTYYEHVVMKKGIALIGAGRDSCVIDIHQSPERDVIIAADSMLIEAFSIIGKMEIDDFSFGIRDMKGGPIISFCTRNNLISNCEMGIFLVNWMDTTIVQEIVGNSFYDNDFGIWIDNEGTSIIADNQFWNNEHAISGRFGKPLILNNEIRDTKGRTIEWLWGHDGVVKNNLITGTTRSEAVAMASSENIIFENNTIAHNLGDGLSLGGYSSIARNNIITGNSLQGVVNSSGVFVYNNVWGNGRVDNIEADSLEGNISEDPMFVGDGDYHL